jgi:hypothetical protein
MMRRRGVGIVGVAAVAHHASNKGAQEQAAADQQTIAAQQAALDAQQAPAAPAAAPVDPQMAQLENLANLHTQGILSDEEYAAAKAKALGI